MPVLTMLLLAGVYSLHQRYGGGGLGFWNCACQDEAVGESDAKDVPWNESSHDANNYDEHNDSTKDDDKTTATVEK